MEQLLVGTFPTSPALQIRSFTSDDPKPAVLGFGVVSPRVADIAWITWTGTVRGLPDCLKSHLQGDFCLFLNDFTSGDEAIAYDANGDEIGRRTFG